MSTANSRGRSSGRDKPQSLSLPMIGVAVAVLLIVIGAVLASRRDEKLPTVYGRRRGSESSRSVNGTAVLADMFRSAGHRVATMGRFSPKTREFQTIVWAPNDFQPPDKEHREFLEEWLKEGDGRTLVYIGRDYDAAIDYWNRTVKEAPSHLADEALHRQAEARASWEAERSMMPLLVKIPSVLPLAGTSDERCSVSCPPAPAAYCVPGTRRRRTAPVRPGRG